MGRFSDNQHDKRASKDALFRVAGNWTDKLLLVFLLGCICTFVLWPMVCIALRSLEDGSGGFTLDQYRAVLGSYGGSLVNSLFVGVLTALFCTVLSVATALVLTTARGWVRVMLMGVLLITMVSPPFVSSLAYIQLYGRRGWISYRLLGLNWSPYNQWGVIWMQSISFVPLNAMFLQGILSKLDDGSIRAARDLGAAPSVILRDVVLPLIRPGILVVLLLTFIRSMADFGTPTIIGGRFNTIASDIYLKLIGYSDLEMSAAMNIFLMMPSIALFFVYRRLMRRCGALTAARQDRQVELKLPLRRCGVLGLLAIGVSALFFLMMVLQYACIFLTGFLKISKGAYSFTLQHWNQLMKYNLSSLWRSVGYALAVSLAGTLFAMLFAYYMDRRYVPGRSFFDCLATLPYMLPGTCFGIGYILAFNAPPLRLTGTAFIVMANMLFKQLPTSTKICSAALTQIPISQELAVRDLGGGRWSALRDVILPGLRPAFLSCFVYNFSSSMTTAGAVIFLIDPGRQLAVFRLFDAVYQGEYAIASLIASCIIAVVLVVEALAFLITMKAGSRHVS